jgi:hypothetical protein
MAVASNPTQILSRLRHVPSFVKAKRRFDQVLVHVKGHADSLAMQDVSLHRLGHGRRD